MVGSIRSGMTGKGDTSAQRERSVWPLTPHTLARDETQKSYAVRWTPSAA
jgi:hypothetical protein